MSSELTERKTFLVRNTLPNTGPIRDRQSFAKDNWIVAGMSEAIIVVESDVDGGAMISPDALASAPGLSAAYLSATLMMLELRRAIGLFCTGRHLARHE